MLIFMGLDKLICKMCNIKNTEVAATEITTQSCSLQTPGADEKIRNHEPAPEYEQGPESSFEALSIVNSILQNNKEKTKKYWQKF